LKINDTNCVKKERRIAMKTIQELSCQMSLTIQEAAKLSNIGILKLRGLVVSDEIPHFKNGVKTMINRQLLEDYIKKISIERRQI